MIYPKFITIMNDEKRIPFRFRQRMNKIQSALIYLRDASDIDYKLYFDGPSVALIDPYYNKILWIINYYDVCSAPAILLKRLDKLKQFWENGKNSIKMEDYLRFISKSYE